MHQGQLVCSQIMQALPIKEFSRFVAAHNADLAGTLNANIYALDSSTIKLTGVRSRVRYPSALRRVSFNDPLTSKELVFLTNNMTLPAATIAALYKQRWIAIAKKRLNLSHSLYEILQRLDLHMFKTIPIRELLEEPELADQPALKSV